jgi:hypothetical protein
MFDTHDPGQPSEPSRPSSDSPRINWGIEPPSVPKTGSENRIEWGGKASSGLPDPASLLGVEDAFDHTPLEAGEKVAYCSVDHVAYHLSTWQFLRTMNQGRCCICGRSSTFLFLVLPGTLAPGKAALVYPTGGLLRPGDEIIKLKEVPSHIGLAVVVQDYVHEVYQTKSTGTYFIRFEPRRFRQPVYEGFKVVIFRDYQPTWEAMGISPNFYQDKIIRVRGVIQQHEKWGIEILVNSPRVIEVVPEDEE